MQANLEKYKQDLERLVKKGDLLHIAMQHDCFPEEEKKALALQRNLENHHTVGFFRID